MSNSAERPSTLSRLAGTSLPAEYEYTVPGAATARQTEMAVAGMCGAAALAPLGAFISWARDPAATNLDLAFSLFFAVLLTGTLIVACSLAVRRNSWLIAGAAIVVTIGVAALTGSGMASLFALIAWALMVVALVGQNRLTATRPISPRVDDRILYPRVIGEPGIGLMSSQALNESGMDVDALRKGMIGEQLSADLFTQALEQAALTPYVQVIHGLKYPGSVNADIDHALVCGGRILLVDSKYWQPNHWRWFGDAMIGGHGENQQVRQSGFTDGVAMVRQMFAPVEVGAAVLIHPNRPGQITVDNSHAGSHPPLVSATDGIDGLLTWLRGGMPPNADEYRRLQSQSMRLVLSITDGFAAPVVPATPQSPVVPGAPIPGTASTTLRATGAEAARFGRWYLDRRRRKRAAFDQKAAHQAQQQQLRHDAQMQRRGENVLRMQHDQLNSERPLWKRKKW